jgi:hypothetical protein
MIVPVYQSEISPAENRGKFACIEFTGNIVGYASSIVSPARQTNFIGRLILNVESVDRLFLLLSHLQFGLENTASNSMYYWNDIGHRYYLHSRISKVRNFLLSTSY